MKDRDKVLLMIVVFVAIIVVVGIVSYNMRDERNGKMPTNPEPDVVGTTIEEQENLENEDVSGEEIEARLEEDVEENIVVSETTPVEEPVCSEDERFVWPVEGDVILSYSVDKPVYFATLDQYKYHPAIVIAAEEGTSVVSVTDGRVLDVKNDPQYGNMVVVDLGSGYTAEYGQLEEIRVQKGQMITKEFVIGYVAKPTKYYSVEGSNLYFKLLKNDKSVNPLTKFDAL